MSCSQVVVRVFQMISGMLTMLSSFFAQGMAEDDQLTYATFALPRAPDGVGGWIYPTKMDVTGYFFTRRNTSLPGPP